MINAQQVAGSGASMKCRVEHVGLGLQERIRWGIRVGACRIWSDRGAGRWLHGDGDGSHDFCQDRAFSFVGEASIRVEEGRGLDSMG